MKRKRPPMRFFCNINPSYVRAVQRETRRFVRGCEEVKRAGQALEKLLARPKVSFRRAP